MDPFEPGTGTPIWELIGKTEAEFWGAARRFVDGVKASAELSVVLMPNTRGRITHGAFKGCEGLVVGYEVANSTMAYVMNLDEYGEVSVYDWAVEAVRG